MEIKLRDHKADRCRILYFPKVSLETGPDHENSPDLENTRSWSWKLASPTSQHIYHQYYQDQGVSYFGILPAYLIAPRGIWIPCTSLKSTKLMTRDKETCKR